MRMSLRLPKNWQPEKYSLAKVSFARIKFAHICLPTGPDVLVMTSRNLVTGKDGAESLNIGSVVAQSLVNFLTGLKSRPRYIIAKVTKSLFFKFVSH